MLIRIQSNIGAYSFKAIGSWLFILMFGLYSCKSSQSGITISRADKKAIKTLDRVFGDNEIIKEHFVGFSLFDPISEQTLLSYNGDLLFTPASNNKLLTYYSSKSVLGDSIPALNYFITGDSIIIRGSGDPNFLSKYDLDSTTFHFLKSRSENIYLDPTNFSGDRFGRGWAWDDYRYLYQKEISAMPIFDNEINIMIDSIGILEVIPNIFKSRVIIDTSFHRSVAREEFTNSMVINPSLLDEDVKIPMHMSDKDVSEALSIALNKNVALIDGLQLSDTLFNTLYHYTTDSIYYHLLVNSDNFIAEQLILCISNEIFGLLDTQRTLDSLGSSVFAEAPGRHRYVDGSGLSRYNLVSPDRMVWTLNQLSKTHSDDKMKSILPYGDEGTIDSIFLRPLGQNLGSMRNPFIYAKTGTLSNNHNMSGYLYTHSGRKLIFSFMNNHYMKPNAVIRKMMHGILSEVYYRF